MRNGREMNNYGTPHHIWLILLLVSTMPTVDRWYTLALFAHHLPQKKSPLNRTSKPITHHF